MKASALKAEGANVSVGSNPTPSDSDFSRMCFALGILRGMVATKCKMLTTEDLEKLDVVDNIINEVVYKYNKGVRPNDSLG